MTCRSYVEYERMFSLDEEVLGAGPILDIAAGASSFVAEAADRGWEAAAVDPLYAMTPEELFEHGKKEIQVSTHKLAGLERVCDWTYYGSLRNHRSMREASLSRFIEDYKTRGKKNYMAGMLPKLPVEDNSQGLVLCSHFLFLYHEQFDYDFHLEAIKEMLRVCRPGGEIRLYPLVTLGWERYPFLKCLLKELEGEEQKLTLMPSSLPFIPGSNQLLRIQKSDFE